MSILKRMTAARSASVTCSASRHAADVAARLVEYQFDADPDPVAAREAGESIAATVAALWEARAEIERLRETVRLADIDSALTTAEVNDLTTEVQRLRAALGANLCPYTAKGHAGDGTVTACVEAGVDAAHELERRGYELKHTHRVGFWVDGRCGYMVSGGYFDTAQRACETAWERVQEAEANDSDPAWKFPTPNA